jgi:tryptophan 2,3-dioxygenase
VHFSKLPNVIRWFVIGSQHEAPALSTISAAFEFEVTEDKIVQIIDQDQGRSVTNDIENVLADLAEAQGVAMLASYQVIYRDTEKDWCRVQLDAADRFQGYAYFGTD